MRLDQYKSASWLQAPLRFRKKICGTRNMMQNTHQEYSTQLIIRIMHGLRVHHLMNIGMMKSRWGGLWIFNKKLKFLIGL